MVGGDVVARAAFLGDAFSRKAELSRRKEVLMCYC
jgi:hypothetical protein